MTRQRRVGVPMTTSSNGSGPARPTRSERSRTSRQLIIWVNFPHIGTNIGRKSPGPKRRTISALLDRGVYSAKTASRLIHGHSRASMRVTALERQRGALPGQCKPRYSKNIRVFFVSRFSNTYRPDNDRPEIPSTADWCINGQTIMSIRIGKDTRNRRALRVAFLVAVAIKGLDGLVETLAGTTVGILGTEGIYFLVIRLTAPELDL